MVYLIVRKQMHKVRASFLEIFRKKRNELNWNLADSAILPLPCAPAHTSRSYLPYISITRVEDFQIMRATKN